ncbi:MAG: C69 family dipeptidase [Flavobacteriales bacterium]|jgi:secernin|nr:C69 family dipeptidase [Flavobacteriales bacterium]
MCDTFIALPNATYDGSVVFAKNSDREANEPQIIEYHPSKLYPKKSHLKCTYINIPQVEKTHAVIISRPFWMWGAEMGVNEHGVVIGNEAVFTKLKVAKNKVLTGMDLLRLALERSNSAATAKQLIIDLLQEFGQGGVGGYQDKNFKYHNSFLIADKTEAWVLETAGIYWATKKVDDFYAISNALTIGEDFDDIHPEAIAFANKKGWVKGAFSFSKAFSDYLYTTFSGSKARQCRASELLKSNYFKIDVTSSMAHLRNHHDADFTPSKSLIGNSICAHAANAISRHASQTTSAMIVHLTADKPTVWVTATSAPCLSVFKPMWFTGMVIPDLGPKPEALFDKDSFWWKNELLHRQILKDYKNRYALIIPEREKLEARLLKNVYQDKKKTFLETKIAFEEHWKLLEEWLQKIDNASIKKTPNLFYKAYWRRLNKKVGIKF